MTQYAKITSDKTLEYPVAKDFSGVINPLSHESILRKAGYVPVSNYPEQQKGKMLVIDSASYHSQTETRIVPVEIEVDDYTENSETHEQEKTGSHKEWSEEEKFFDTSYITIDSFRYEDIIVEPEPEPVVNYSKYKLQLACQKRGLWEQVKAAIASAGMTDSWSNIIDIASDNSELVAALPIIKAAFGSDVVEAVLSESIA